MIEYLDAELRLKMISFKKSSEYLIAVALWIERSWRSHWYLLLMLIVGYNATEAVSLWRG